MGIWEVCISLRATKVYISNCIYCIYINYKFLSVQVCAANWGRFRRNTSGPEFWWGVKPRNLLYCWYCKHNRRGINGHWEPRNRFPFHCRSQVVAWVRLSNFGPGGGISHRPPAIPGPVPWVSLFETLLYPSSKLRGSENSCHSLDTRTVAGACATGFLRSHPLGFNTDSVEISPGNLIKRTPCHGLASRQLSRP